MAVRRGELIREFQVAAIDGVAFDYRDIWQRQNLLLIALREPPSDAAMQYLASLTGRHDALAEFETRCVATTERVPGINAPALIVADRWGEIYLASEVHTVAELPSASEVFECLRYIAYECPEWQGEAR
jgi:hypothetical protein